MLIVHTSIPGPSLPASWLNRRVSVSHTGVSSDGTELTMSTLPFASLRRTAWRLVSTAVKSGARWPGLISGPTRVSGVPLRVTTPFFSCAMTVSSWSREVWGVPQSIARALHCARMGVRLARLLVAALAPWALAAPAGAGSSVVILSTTTSTQDSGLLDVLVPRFERQTGYTVKTISVGTGQALALAAPGYIESGQGMGATLGLADDRRAYTLTDRATLLAFGKRVALTIMVEGDQRLRNVYSVMEVSPANGPRVNTGGARAFADFMVSPEVQQIIRTFGVDRHGRPLFVPIAGQHEEDVAP